MLKQTIKDFINSNEETTKLTDQLLIKYNLYEDNYLVYALDLGARIKMGSCQYIKTAFICNKKGEVLHCFDPKTTEQLAEKDDTSANAFTPVLKEIKAQIFDFVDKNIITIRERAYNDTEARARKDIYSGVAKKDLNIDLASLSNLESFTELLKGSKEYGEYLISFLENEIKQNYSINSELLYFYLVNEENKEIDGDYLKFKKDLIDTFYNPKYTNLTIKYENDGAISAKQLGYRKNSWDFNQMIRKMESNDIITKSYGKSCFIPLYQVKQLLYKDKVVFDAANYEFKSNRENEINILIDNKKFDDLNQDELDNKKIIMKCIKVASAYSDLTKLRKSCLTNDKDFIKKLADEGVASPKVYKFMSDDLRKDEELLKYIKFKPIYMLTSGLDAREFSDFETLNLFCKYAEDDAKVQMLSKILDGGLSYINTKKFADLITGLPEQYKFSMESNYIRRVNDLPTLVSYGISENNIAYNFKSIDETSYSVEDLKHYMDNEYFDSQSFLGYYTRIGSFFCEHQNLFIEYQHDKEFHEKALKMLRTIGECKAYLEAMNFDPVVDSDILNELITYNPLFLSTMIKEDANLYIDPEYNEIKEVVAKEDSLILKREYDNIEFHFNSPKKYFLCLTNENSNQNAECQLIDMAKEEMLIKHIYEAFPKLDGLSVFLMKKRILADESLGKKESKDLEK